MCGDIIHMSDLIELEIVRFSNELNTYLSSRYCYKKRLCFVVNRNVIMVEAKRVSLYLRYKPQSFFNNNTLVVARIEFQKTRNGNGKDLLRFFASIAAKYQIEHIGFEQVITEDSISFTNKYKFRKIFNDNQITISIRELEEKIANYM